MKDNEEYCDHLGVCYYLKAAYPLYNILLFLHSLSITLLLQSLNFVDNQVYPSMPWSFVFSSYLDFFRSLFHTSGQQVSACNSNLAPLLPGGRPAHCRMHRGNESHRKCYKLSWAFQ